MRSNRYWAAPVLGAAAVALLAACGGSASPGATSTGNAPAAPAASSPTTKTTSVSATGISTRSTSIGTVLVDSQGHTLYWFAIDTPTTSKCTGVCLQYWPPVLGTPTAAAGMHLPKAFGTITLADGKTQATYDGHPLYSYAADTSAGTVNGNGLDTSGGLWWAMTTTGAIVHGGGASPSTSSGGGGYGY